MLITVECHAIQNEAFAKSSKNKARSQVTDPTTEVTERESDLAMRQCKLMRHDGTLHNYDVGSG